MTVAAETGEGAERDGQDPGGSAQQQAELRVEQVHEKRGSDSAGKGGGKAPEGEATKNGAGSKREPVDPSRDWTTLEIPAINGSIKIPPGWNRPTADQVLRSLDFIDFAGDEERMKAEMDALAIGRVALHFSRYPEPREGANPSLHVTWEELPITFDQLPLESRSAALARTLSSVSLPAMKKKDPGFRLLEGPKEIDQEGGGAWTTFRSSTRLKSGGRSDSVTRLYVVPGRDHIITVTLVTPVDSKEAEDSLPELWTMFESMTYSR